MNRKKNNVIVLNAYARKRKNGQFNEKTDIPATDHPASEEGLDDCVPRNPFISMAPYYEQAVEYIIKKKMEEERKRETTETQIEEN